MGQQGPLPYLNFCGTEVSNGARVVGYLRRGLGGDGWELGPGNPCGVLYRLDGASCASPHAFVSPQADPAPWYDAAEPGSRTFLGFHLLDVKGYDSTIERGISQRVNALGGGVFGGQTRTPRTWKFRAAMISADDAGAEYGLRWLTQALQASECDSCSTCELTVRLACPPENCSNDQLGEWISYDAALVDGPHEVDSRGPGVPAEMQDALGGCREFVLVEWTMVAANPFLYKRPQTVSYYTLTQATACVDICSFLFGANAPQCFSVSPPERGVLGTIVTLTSDDGFGSVLLQGYSTCGSSLAPVGEPDVQIQLSGVPAASTVVVDSAQHKIIVATINPDTGGVDVGDGTNLVQLATNKAIEWLEVRNCDDISCFCVSAATPCEPGTVEVTVQTQVREG